MLDVNKPAQDAPLIHARFRGALQPFDGLGIIFWNAAPVLIHHREIALRRCMSFIGGLAIESHRFGIVFLDTAAMKPIARCGYNDYAVVEAVFSMRRPKGG